MASALENEVRGWMRRFRAGEVPLAVFAEHIEIASWELAPGADKGAEELLSPMVLALAEYSLGHRTEKEVTGLAESLATAMSFEMVTAPAPRIGSTTGSAGQVRHFDLELCV